MILKYNGHAPCRGDVEGYKPITLHYRAFLYPIVSQALSLGTLIMVNGVWLRPGLSSRGNVTGITFNPYRNIDTGVIQ